MELPRYPMANCGKITWTQRALYHAGCNGAPHRVTRFSNDVRQLGRVLCLSEFSEAQPRDPCRHLSRHRDGDHALVAAQLSAAAAAVRVRRRRLNAAAAARM